MADNNVIDEYGNQVIDEGGNPVITNNPAWLGTWAHRIKLDIDYTNDIGASVTQFPVTIFLKAANGDTENVFTEITTNNLKMAITQADGTTQMYGEIEQWDNPNQIGIIHTSLAGWVVNADTSIYLYYDNAQADNSSYIGVINSVAGAAVWDSNFLSVQHLVDATTSTIRDSTAYDDDGTKLGANTPLEAVGQVYKGQDFESTGSHYITLTDIQAAVKNITIEALVKRESTGSVYHTIASDYNSAGQLGFIFAFWGGATPDRLDFYTGAGGWKYSTSTITDTANFYHVATVLDNSATPNVQFYISGAADGANQAAGVINTANGAIRIGRQGASDNFFDGIIDEVRYSNIARSAAWIKGTKNTLFDTLLTYGTEESPVVDDSYNASALGLTVSQQTPIENYDYQISVSSQALALSQPSITLNYDYSISVLTQELTLAQQTPTQTYDYQLDVSAQGLSLSQQIPETNFDYSFGVDVLALNLSHQDITVDLSIEVSVDALGLSLSQLSPELNYDYSLEVVSQALALSQPTPETTYDYSLNVSTQELTISQLSPEVSLSADFYPATLGLLLSQYSPETEWSSSVDVSALSLALSQFSPEISLSISYFPETLGLEISQPSPELHYDYALSLSALELIAALYSPKLTVDWIKGTKNTADFTAGTKHTAEYTNLSKNTSDWTAGTKNTSELTASTKNTADWIAQTKNYPAQEI